MPSCQVKCLHEEWLKGNQLWQPSFRKWEREKKKRKKKKERNQLWQPSCQNPKGVRREKIRIVAIKLPEMGGKKEKRKKKNCGRNLIVI